METPLAEANETKYTPEGTPFRSMYLLVLPLWKNSLDWNNTFRQPMSVMESEPVKLVFVSSVILNILSPPKGLGAVSYTHLDVYKRQVMD